MAPFPFFSSSSTTRVCFISNLHDIPAVLFAHHFSIYGKKGGDFLAIFHRGPQILARGRIFFKSILGPFGAGQGNPQSMFLLPLS